MANGNVSQYVITGSNNTTISDAGIYLTSTATRSNFVPYTSTGTTLSYTFQTTYTTYNGDPNVAYTGSQIFKTLEEKIEYQQKAYEEPRDHAYNPDSFGTCMECYAHNLHRHSADKHLYVIDEEIPWSDRLAS